MSSFALVDISKHITSPFYIPPANAALNPKPSNAEYAYRPNRTAGCNYRLTTPPTTSPT